MKSITMFGLKHSKDIKMSKEELKECVEILFQTLSEIEPFELVNVEAIDNGKKVKVLIKTI